ncbi:MAG: DUF4238 domain-containing protein [Chloroflexota bacterium]
MGDRFRWNEPILAPTDVKRQHYVPRTYLRPFCGTDGNIRVVELQGIGREYRTSVDNVAVETKYNNLETDIGHVSTESWLSEVEDLAAPVLRRLIDEPNNIVGLSDEEEIHLARFIAALRFRVPQFRNWSKQLRADILGQVKEFTHTWLENQLEEDEARATWEVWEDKPDEWWFHEDKPVQPGETTTYMLGEVLGYANLLRAMPWRIGLVPETEALHTSDNPVGGFLSPAQAMRYGGGFAEFHYFLPLSPRVLLKIMPIASVSDKGPLQHQGKRERRDFSTWDASFAQNVLTRDATRFLFGDGSTVTREHATSYLAKVERAITQLNSFLSDKPPFHKRHAAPMLKRSLVHR